jgi:hypothetical protein
VGMRKEPQARQISMLMCGFARSSELASVTSPGS